MYAHVMLILINQCLLNVVFSITKALNGQISRKQHFYYPPPFNTIWKPLLLLMLFSSLSHSLFNFKPYEILTDPTPVGTL